MKKFIICSLIAASFASVSFTNAADLYVQSVKAPIFSEPSLGSKRLTESAKGDLLKEIDKKGDWYQIDYKGVSGWISRLLVSTKPPLGKVSILEETEEVLEKGARKRASAFATAAAARGLAEERARISDKYKVDYEGVEWMEALKIADEDASQFLQEGVGQ